LGERRRERALVLRRERSEIEQAVEEEVHQPLAGRRGENPLEVAGSDHVASVRAWWDGPPRACGRARPAHGGGRETLMSRAPGGMTRLPPEGAPPRLRMHVACLAFAAHAQRSTRQGDEP